MRLFMKVKLHIVKYWTHSPIQTSKYWSNETRGEHCRHHETRVDAASLSKGEKLKWYGTTRERHGQKETVQVKETHYLCLLRRHPGLWWDPRPKACRMWRYLGHAWPSARWSSSPMSRTLQDSKRKVRTMSVGVGGMLLAYYTNNKNMVPSRKRGLYMVSFFMVFEWMNK